MMSRKATEARFAVHKLLGLLVCVAVVAPALAEEEDAHPTIRKHMAHPYYALKAVEQGPPFVLDHHRGKKVVMLHLAAWDGECASQLVDWKQFAKKAGDSLTFVGIIHDQHADRAALFAKWKGIDFPLYHDRLNVPDARRVGRAVCVDEFGVVQHIGRTPADVAEKFLAREYKLDRSIVRPPVDSTPNYKHTKRLADEALSCPKYVEHGDACLFEPAAVLIDEAIRAYQQALVAEPDSAPAAFRLGCAYRMRFDSTARQPGDLAHAFDAWSLAAKRDPRNQIFVERVLQYGAASDKLFSSYGWVDEALKKADGITLNPSPMAIEKASPSPDFKPDADGAASAPELPTNDSAILVESGIVRSPKPKVAGLINVVIALIPQQGEIAAGQTIRVWIAPSNGVEVAHRIFDLRLERAATQENPAMLSVAAKIPQGQSDSRHVLKCIAVFSSNGQKVRADFEVPIPTEIPAIGTK